MLARISGEVGTLCTVLLSVYSETCLPVFIEIGSYLTDTEQKISWHVYVLETVSISKMRGSRASKRADFTPKPQ